MVVSEELEQFLHLEVIHDSRKNHKKNEIKKTLKEVELGKNKKV